MKRLLVIAILLACSAAATALAVTRVETKDGGQPRAQADIHASYDHPMTQVVPNDDLRVVITSDVIMRSCCMPSRLVVGGKITNISGRPIDYVRLHFAFEDSNGKVLHGESLYNYHAESLSDDAYIRKILNEKPHFEPIGPGQSDTFRFSIPCVELPRFSKVELFSDAVK